MISRTSIYVAAGRAVGAREPDPSVRNPDHLAEALLGEPSALGVDHPVVRALSLPYDEAMQDFDVVTSVRMMMVRTRFIDNALARAIESGIGQVVILGAGFDSHAYRFQALLADARVFEVDRPDTQALKRTRVREALGDPPANLTYVPIDIQHESLPEVLARHAHDHTRRTFFILEGVTMYLPEAAVRSTLQFIGGQPAGSVVVFDFVFSALIEMIARIDIKAVPESNRAWVQRFLDLIKYEPWIFGLPMGSEREFLAEFGLEPRELFAISGDDSLTRYLTKDDGTVVGAAVIAEATARMSQAAPQDPERARQMQRMMSYQLTEAVRVGPVTQTAPGYFGGAGTGTVPAASGQLPSYGGQFGTASSGAG